MQIKLLALDLDHTLLNSERKIAKEDLLAVRAAREAGVIITVATGRMFCAAQQYAKDLEIDVPIITYQGSLIRKLLSEDILCHLKLNCDIAQEVLLLAADAGIHVNTYIGDKLYVSQRNDLVERYIRVNKVPVLIDPDYLKALTVSPTKIVFVENDIAKLDKFQAQIEAKYADKWDVTRSLPHLLEIGHPDATKAKALAFLSHHLGIKQAEIMAIGDGLNDLDMLRYAGIGVAMGNAPLEIKRRANWVTRDNKDRKSVV